MLKEQIARINCTNANEANLSKVKDLEEHIHTLNKDNQSLEKYFIYLGSNEACNVMLQLICFYSKLNSLQVKFEGLNNESNQNKIEIQRLEKLNSSQERYFYMI